MAFAAVYQMGTYHHVRAHKAYLAVRLETGFKHPGSGHIGKIPAGKPGWLRVEYAGGRGAIWGTENQQQERLADERRFLLWQFGL